MKIFKLKNYIKIVKLVQFYLEKVTYLREKYPQGTRVRLLEMDDSQAPPIGSLGTVLSVNDAQGIKVAWDSGGSLNMLYGVDCWEVVE